MTAIHWAPATAAGKSWRQTMLFNLLLKGGSRIAVEALGRLCVVPPYYRLVDYGRDAITLRTPEGALVTYRARR